MAEGCLRNLQIVPIAPDSYHNTRDSYLEFPVTVITATLIVIKVRVTVITTPVTVVKVVSPYHRDFEGDFWGVVSR